MKFKTTLTKYMLVIGTYLICKADIGIIESNSLWDNAADRMVKIRPNVVGLHKLSARFNKIAQKGIERADDLNMIRKRERRLMELSSQIH